MTAVRDCAGTYVRDPAFACRLVAGRIAERWAIRDDLAMLLQLGRSGEPWMSVTMRPRSGTVPGGRDRPAP